MAWTCRGYPTTMETVMLEKYKIRVPHRDVELLVSVAAAVFAVLFPQYQDAALMVLAACGFRFGVRASGAIGQGLEANRALPTLHLNVGDALAFPDMMDPVTGETPRTGVVTDIAEEVPDPVEPREDSQAAALAAMAADL